MRVTLLGTGGSAGVPMIGGPDGTGDWGACDPKDPRNRRTRASILIEGETGTLLVDTGPELRLQCVTNGVSRVDAILYTHAHADHITGLDDVRLLNRIMGRPIDAYATAPVLTEIARRFDYAFRPWEPPDFFRPVLTTHTVTAGATATMAGFDVHLFEQSHGFGTSLGLRIGPFAYSTDVVTLNETAFATLAGVEVWVVGCFQRAPHKTHAWLARVIEWAGRVRANRTILTHMGNDMDFATIAAALPEGCEPGIDGQVLSLTR